MTADQGLTPAEMEAEDATALPDREAMSTLAGRAADPRPRRERRCRAGRRGPDRREHRRKRERRAPGGRGRLGQHPVGGCAGRRVRAADLRDRPDPRRRGRRRPPTRIPPSDRARTADMGEHDQELSLSELEAETAEGLPERAAMSTHPAAAGERGAGAGRATGPRRQRRPVRRRRRARSARPSPPTPTSRRPIDAAVAANVASPDAHRRRASAAAELARSSRTWTASRTPRPTRRPTSSRARAAGDA